MDIDWSKAPLHATHWCPGNAIIDAGWIYQAGQEFYSCYAEKGLEHIPNFPAWRALRLIPRPVETPKWNGEGLPPVGADVECTFAVEDHKVWHRGTVVHRAFQPEGGEFVVVSTGAISACYRADGTCVRPYRTPEQIAAEERVKAAQVWLKAIEAEYGFVVAGECEDILMKAEASKKVAP